MLEIMEFEKFPKIARLFRDCTITEKIDGTNAQLLIEDVPAAGYVPFPGVYADNGFDPSGESIRLMKAGSRNRWLSRESDNFGFCKWAFDNGERLMMLGPGRHFGEWWGAGIQRRYGLSEKRFSLFDVGRWEGQIPEPLTGLVHVVPVVYQGPFSTEVVDWSKGVLKERGSFAAPGFMNPEGVVVWHAAARVLFKSIIEGDEKPKGSKEV